MKYGLSRRVRRPPGNRRSSRRQRPERWWRQRGGRHGAAVPADGFIPEKMACPARSQWTSTPVRPASAIPEHLVEQRRGRVGRVGVGVGVVVPAVVAEEFEHPFVAVELQGSLPHAVVPVPLPEIEAGLALRLDQIADHDHAARGQRCRQIPEQPCLGRSVEMMDGERRDEGVDRRIEGAPAGLRDVDDGHPVRCAGRLQPGPCRVEHRLRAVERTDLGSGEAAGQGVAEQPLPATDIDDDGAVGRGRDDAADRVHLGLALGHEVGAVVDEMPGIVLGPAGSVPGFGHASVLGAGNGGGTTISHRGPSAPGKLQIQRDERTVQSLGQSGIPGVVAGEVAPQLPYALGKRRKGKQRQVEPKQLAIRGSGLEPRDLTGSFESAQDVAGLDQHQLGTGEETGRHDGLRPCAGPARIDQRRDQHGRIDDRRHVRSASRARRMLEGRILVPAASLRSRTCCSHAAGEGRDAIRSSSQRRNSCMD